MKHKFFRFDIIAGVCLTSAAAGFGIVAGGNTTGAVIDIDVIDGDDIETGDVVDGIVAVCGNGNGTVTSGFTVVVSFYVVDKLINICATADSLFFSTFSAKCFCFLLSFSHNFLLYSLLILFSLLSIASRFFLF
jgi:hypothetical protein